MLQFNGATNHLIVCNRAALTVTNMIGDAIFTGGNLAIYRQSGTGVRGTLTAYGDGYGIYAEEGVTTNGVDIAASGVHGDAIAYLLTGLTVNGRDVGFLSGPGWHSDGEHTVYLTNAGPFTVSGSTTAGLGIEATTNAQVTLSDVLIDSSAYEDRIAFRVASGASVEFTLIGDNTLKTADGDSASAKGRAALEVAEGASVTIDGEGSLTAIAGTPDGQSGGAGIGGGYGQNAGAIEIRGGTITAQTYLSGAGIGGGTGGNGGTTTISGGVVSAQGRQSGIGGGYQGHGGAITISGGTVYARGTVSGRPDIGGMVTSNAASCIISGGSVHTHSPDNVNPAATNANHVAVHCVTIAGLPADTEQRITWLTAADSGYGQNDMRTDSNGRLYVWLPDGEHYLSVAGVGFHAVVAGEDTTAEPWSGAFVHYVDANGDVQQCVDFTVLTNAAGDVEYGEIGSEKWYVVTNDVTISGNLYFVDTAHLILCDGATLTVTNENGNAIGAYNLTIYCQTNGTGSVTANCSDYGIAASGTLTINGGSVTATGDDCGIYANATVTINGGNVTATATDEYGIGINADNGNVTINGGSVTSTGGDCGIYAGRGDVTINGGSVTATGGIGINANNGDVTINGGSVTATTTSEYGYGIYASGNITLGWTNPTDSIYASSYYDIVCVKSGKRLTDGIGGIYEGDILDPDDIAGKTLRPAFYTVRFDANGGAGAMPGQTFTNDAQQALTSNAFTRTGYTFVGWRGGDGSIYPDGATVSNLTVRHASLPEDAWKRFDRMPYPGSSNDDYRPGKLYDENYSGDGALQLKDANNGLNLYTGFENVSWNPADPATAALISANAAWFDEHDARNGVSMKLIEDFPNFYFPSFYIEQVNDAQGAAVTLTAIWQSNVPVPYIDADGNEQICTIYTVLTNATGDVAYGEYGAENWYVVTNDVTISGRLYFADYHTHLILCDGATLTVSKENAPAIDAYGLSIYCQTNATGALVANGSDSGIDGEFVIINGGSVTATGGGGYSGIYANYDITINGGNVNASGGYGIWANITLGWTNSTDSIYASSYYGYVCVKSGQLLTDGYGGIYEGNNIDPDDIEGKTLRPCFKDPEGAVINDYAVIEWLAENGFTQADINALGHDNAATERLYECWLLNLNFKVQGAGATLSFTDITVSNRVSMTVQFVRKAPLAGCINGTLLIYGANDLAAGFSSSPIPDESVEYFTGDPTFNLVTASNDTVTQTAVATLNSSVTAKFFKAEIGIESHYEPEPEDPWGDPGGDPGDDPDE